MTMTTAYALPPASLAPWAEIVPGIGPVTVDILLTLPDDGYIYEVVEGVLIRVAGSGNRVTRLAMRLGARLLDYVEPRRLGVITGADGVYKFPGAETGLVPDVGYYGASRLSLITDEDKPIPFAPELAVEVASPSQDALEMAAKARRYLDGGTRLVWIVWPHGAHIDVWHVDARNGPSVTLGINDALDGVDIVPGFTYQVRDLFAEPLSGRRADPEPA
jgi:Uma2 family endonuclease